MDYLKKNVVILLFCLTTLTANAKNYYISSSKGNDGYTAAEAQNDSTPWKTLAKVNSFFLNLNPGDSVLFRRGETFYGSLVVTNSGSPVLPIVVGAYGIGAKPVISGFTTLSAWTSLDGNIYESPCAAFSANGNMVILNGIQQTIGRYPNTGYLKIDAHSGTNSISSQSLSGGPNWKGAEVVIRKTRWVIDRNEILSQSGNNLTYKSSSNYTPLDGFGYFIQKSAKTLDQLGEWYFDPIGKKMQMYFGKDVPNSYQVKVATVDTLINIRNNNDINFENISFQGSNVSTFMLNNANNVSIRGCDISFSGTNAITGASTSTSLTVENTTINHTNNNAIELAWQCTNTKIRNNTIKNTGLFAGLGLDGDGVGAGSIGTGYGSYSAIVCNGSNVSIEGNTIDSVGYIGIRFHGSIVLVKNNLVNNFCVTKDDGAGIYDYRGEDTNVFSDRTVANNIVLNGIGAGEGTNEAKSRAAEGIYMDDNTTSVEIIGNTTANCTKGIFLHNAHNILLTSNTFYNNNIQLFMSEDHGNDLIRNIKFTHNVVFSKDLSQPAVYLLSDNNDIRSFGTFDSNTYASPFQQNPIFVAEVDSEVPSFTALAFQNWRAFYGQDQNSIQSEINIPSFSLKGLVGANRFRYGSFEGRTDLPWISTYSIGANAVSSYDGARKLDGTGALKVSYPSPNDSKVELSIGDIGAVNTTKNYILRFSTLGVDKNRTIGICLRKYNTPYNNLTPFQYITIPSIRNDNEVLFSLPDSEANASIIFQLNGADGTIWLDNIEFYEANAVVVNPDDYIRFEYNATNTIKNINLDKTYVDAKNNNYQTKLSLAPYSSIVLTAVRDNSEKLSQTLNFPALSDTTYGVAPLTLRATSSSGLPVVYSILSGAGTLTDSTITIKAAGALVIGASQPGNLVYNAAPAVTQTINIKKADQTIFFTSLITKTFGDGPFLLLASSSSNLPITYKVISGPAVLSGNQLSLTGVGVVNIEASQAGDENFNPTTITQIFTINKGKQIISFSPITAKILGDIPFSLTATSSSSLPISYRIVSGPASISESKVTLTAVGTVAIEATQEGDDTYEAAPPVIQTIFVGNSLKVNQTINAEAVSPKNYGDDPFTLTASSSSGLPIGFKVVSGPAFFSNNKVVLTGAGLVSMELSQLGDQKYNPAPSVSQSFMVNKSNPGLEFEALPDKLSNDSPFNLETVSRGQGAVSFTSSNSAVITVSNKSGKWVATIVGSGLATITAFQATDDRYSEMSISRTLLIKDALNATENVVVLKTFPNPFTTYLNIQFTPIESGNTNLTVYDLHGIVLKVLFRGEVNARELMSFILDGTGLKTGVYIVSLTIGNKNLVKKVLFRQI